MSKFCQNCGNENEDNASYCRTCGAPLAANQQQPQMNQQMENQYYNSQTKPNIIPYRNIVTAIILSIITCGIYGIYWFVVMTDDAKKVSRDEQGAGGGLAFLLTLVTCGIYSIYWHYKQGKRLYDAGKNYGVDIKDNSVLYLILGIFGLGLVSYILIQSDLNKFSAGQ